MKTMSEWIEKIIEYHIAGSEAAKNSFPRCPPNFGRSDYEVAWLIGWDWTAWPWMIDR